MDSGWLESRTSSGGGIMDTDTSYSSRNEYIPAWKMPISKLFSSAISGGEKSGSESGIGSGGERDNSTSSNSDPESYPVDALKRKETIGMDKEEEGQLIQILLPCIICNRTFSPEALQRHNTVCTKVNVKTPYKQDRGKFDIAEQRKKGTRVEYFIPPPSTDSLVDNPASCFSRGSKNRSSLRGTSCTTRSTLNSESLSLHQIGLGPSTQSPLRRQRSISQTRGHSKLPSEFPYDDHSEFGSNSEESHTIHDTNLPSYAKPLAPTDECPFCNRCFGPKAYDRHVGYCKEKFVQRQYEIQPVPKDRIEAMERQEIRTKYRPMKGSSSCTSLRSVSPAKDFTSMAYKLFGLRRSDGAGNLYNNQLSNFQKSNESLANSCYGDFTRGMRRPSPSPSRHNGGNTMSVTNKINNLLSKTFHYQQNPTNTNNNNNSAPMKINTTSNIPKLAKSSDNLSMMSGTGSHFAHVPSSGYGPQAIANNSFNRNDRSRSSLHKNFFRSSSKRVEPEGTENTGTMTNSSGGSSSPLIITPMTFYAKSNKSNQSQQELYRPKGNTFLSQDPSYDPYEMAAKQLEELLKSQPINKNVNKKTARKLGLEKAFESVGVHSDNNHNNSLQDENTVDRNKSEDPFVFDLASEKMGDSYWEEILQKSGSSGGDEKKEQNQMLMSKPETKSKQSDSNISDSIKSRALSQISSADSGFSRSEVNDSEFEAMESLVGVGEVPQPTRSLMKRQQLEPNPLSSFHPSLSLSSRMPFMKRSQIQSQRLSKEPESPMQMSPTTRRDSDTAPNTPTEGGGGGTGARFCHECGNNYPSAVAKFCPECGEKRVFKF